MTVVDTSRTRLPCVDGLLYHKKWNLTTITYSFPTQERQFTHLYEGEERFSSITEEAKAAIRDIFVELARIVPLDFLEQNENPEKATIRIVARPIDGAYAQFPGEGDEAGDIWISSLSGFEAPVKGSYGYMTLCHEIGHALGLKHPHDNVVFGCMPADQDCFEFTVMSYRAYAGGAPTGQVNCIGYPGFMMHDLLSLAVLYGLRSDYRSGDTVYTWDPHTGQSYVDGVGSGIPAGGRIFETILDCAGWDTYDCSNYDTPLAIDLRPGRSSKLADEQLAYLGRGHIAHGNVFNALFENSGGQFLIEAAIGGSAGDVITGNAAANDLRGRRGNDIIAGGAGDDYISGGDGHDILSGEDDNDVVEGGDGNDVIAGGKGNDYLLGGKGRNLFVFHPGDGHDLIADFTAGEGSNIDLRHFHLRDAKAALACAIEGNGSTTLVLSARGEAATQITILGMTLDEIASRPDMLVV
ncbi:M10 family metallopeptidase C-terminal domain-containing protein [Chelatococcus sp. GCM10030263]|uniref:M10 family metallopeptidase C-terminal domain-containing protein n=1 Tax=Chelatococcus sp. GCM10030263 TaxID=3273387 RepID=UPI003606769E